MKKYCESCGAELIEDDKFCAVCGTPCTKEAAVIYKITKKPKEEKGDIKKALPDKKAVLKKAVPIVSAAAVLAAAAAGIYGGVMYYKYEHKYKLAEKLLNQKNYQASADLYSELGDYKDSREKLSNFLFFPAYINDQMYEYTYKYDAEDGFVNKASASVSSEYSTSDKTLEESYEYQNGYMQRRSSIYSSAGLKDRNSSTEYSYDQNNRLVKTLETSYGKTDTRYEYNSERSLLSTNVRKDKREEGGYSAEYNSDGKKISETVKEKQSYGMGHESEYKVIYDDGKIVSETYTTTSSDASYEKQYTYEGDRLTESNSSYSLERNGVNTEYKVNIQYEYDKEGRVLKATVKPEYDEAYKNEFYVHINDSVIYFDENGNISEIEKEGKKYRNTYDKYGNLTYNPIEEKEIRYQLVGYSENPKNKGRLCSSSMSWELNMNWVYAAYLPIYDYGINSVYDYIGIRDIDTFKELIEN